MTSNVSSGLKTALREWVEEHAQRPIAGGLLDDTPILEQRIITSIQVMELLLFIEKLSGKGLNVEQMKPNSFRSIDTICATFFSDVQP